MKIACLIRDTPPLRYFVNHIDASDGVALVVVESPPARRASWGLVRKKGLAGTLAALRNRIAGVAGRGTSRAVFDRHFGDQWRKLRPGIPVLRVDSVNADSVRDALEQLKPDLILDHGTSIVRNHILETAPLALNLHWGLSPYYRGVACTEWALLHWDPYNIGVTIHRLAREVDGGDIVAQRRATVTADDTVLSIDMQLTRLGTELVVRIVDELKNGRGLTFHRQEYGFGQVTYKRQWSRFMTSQIRAIENPATLRRMLKHPSRTERLPIIELE